MSKQKKCYNTAVKRGQITDKTISIDFEDAIECELDELKESTVNQIQIDLFDSCDDVFPIDFDSFERLLKNSSIMEVADIVITCYSYSEFLGFDLDKAVQMKMKYNESR